MAFVLADRVKETTTTSGTGSLSLGGAVGGFVSFSSGIGVGNTTYYVIENDAKFEIGIGTVSSGSLSRDTVIASSEGGSKVSLTGLSFVFVALPASKTVLNDEVGSTSLPGSLSLLTDNSEIEVDNLLVHKYGHINNITSSGEVISSGMLTLTRTGAGSFFHAYKEGTNPTIALYSDAAESPEWKLGLKANPNSSGDAPTYGYIHAEDGNIGLYANDANTLSLSHSLGFVLKNKGNTTITSSNDNGTSVNGNTAAYPVLILKSASAQSANIQEWHNSAGTALSYVDKSGELFITGHNVLSSIDSNSASGVAISGWAKAYVDLHSHNDAVNVSGALQPQITQNAEDIITVSGMTTVGIDALPHVSGEHFLAQIDNNSASGVAISGYTDYAVGSGADFTISSGNQNHAYIGSVSGWATGSFGNSNAIFAADILANSASGVAISGYNQAFTEMLDRLPHESGYHLLSEIRSNSTSGDIAYGRITANSNSGVAISGYNSAYTDIVVATNVDYTSSVLHASGLDVGLSGIQFSDGTTQTTAGASEGVLANSASGVAISGYIDYAVASGSALTVDVSGYNSAYTDIKVAALVDSAPAALDTLNELAAAINDDASISTTLTNLITVNTTDIRANSASGTAVLAELRTESASGVNHAADIIRNAASGTAALAELRIESASGTQAFAEFRSGFAASGLTYANGVDNRITTFTDTNALNGEANLTFDGTELALSGNATIDGNLILGSSGVAIVSGISVGDSGVIFPSISDGGFQPNAGQQIVVQPYGGTTTFVFDRYFNYTWKTIRPLSDNTNDIGRNDQKFKGGYFYEVQSADKLHASGLFASGITVNSTETALVPVTVKAAASQSANLQEWQDSNGLVIASVAADGAIASSGDATIDGNLTLGSSGVVIASGVSVGGSGLLVNDISSATASTDINITSTDDVNIKADSSSVIRFYTGSTSNFIVTGTEFYPSSDNSRDLGLSNRRFSDVFTVSTHAENVNAETVKTSGLFASGITVNSTETALVPVTVKAAASHSANLQEWQDSDGLVIASIAADGAIASSGDAIIDGNLTLGSSGVVIASGISVGDSGVASPNVVAAVDNLTLQSNNGQALISLANGGAVSITAYNSIYQQFTTDGVGYRQDLYPIFSTLDMGSDANRWQKIYTQEISASGDVAIDGNLTLGSSGIASASGISVGVSGLRFSDGTTQTTAGGGDGDGSAADILANSASGVVISGIAAAGGGSRSVAGDVDNSIITWVTSDNTFAAESTFLYDGSTVSLSGDILADGNITLGSSGTLISSGVSSSGLRLGTYTPLETNETLYNDGGTLKFNGSAVGLDHAISSGQKAYDLAVAVTYASGNANLTAINNLTTELRTESASGVNHAADIIRNAASGTAALAELRIESASGVNHAADIIRNAASGTATNTAVTSLSAELVTESASGTATNTSVTNLTTELRTESASGVNHAADIIRNAASGTAVLAELRIESASGVNHAADIIRNAASGTATNTSVTNLTTELRTESASGVVNAADILANAASGVVISGIAAAGGGGGGGSVTTVKADGSQVGGADIVTLDFSSDFGVAETPDTEINITIGTLNQDTTGSAATLTTARTIGGTSFNGSANIAVALATLATTVTITDNESTDESNALIFTAGGDIDGGNLGLESDGTLTYNPSTGKVTATGFVGTLTGAVTGDVTGDVTGNADTATAFATARNINGVSFNGSANITVTAAGSTLSDTVTVAKGGTNATSFADKAVIITQDSGDDTLAAVAMDANGELLIGGTSGPAVATLTAGSNMTITNANGGITLASSTGGGVSDQRLKDNVEDLDINALDKVDDLRPVEFDWNQTAYDGYNELEGREFGLIAQEVEDIFPEIVSVFRNHKAIDYSKLTVILIKAVQELRQEVETLKSTRN